MRGRSVLLDTNLLVLLIVVTVNQDYIRRHKRTRAYDLDSFQLLLDLLAGFRTVVTTPNILTEASNLLRHGGDDPISAEIAAAFQRFAEQQPETYLPSRDAARRPEFHRLGLTDCVIMALGTQPVSVLTDDLDLYISSVRAGLDAHNFAHYREARL